MGSILYACEVYYNLKKKELREIERIEEGYLRQVFKTSKGCPITQLYLEMGQLPETPLPEVYFESKRWQLTKEIMKKNKFKEILRGKIEVNALNYLIEKQGKKGKAIKYSQLKTLEYLSISGKR